MLGLGYCGNKIDEAPEPAIYKWKSDCYSSEPVAGLFKSWDRLVLKTRKLYQELCGHIRDFQTTNNE